MKVFALVDCNNFYVSCERVFNPKLINKPVAVLSSNDACIIARSNEVKALGVKMGDPFFECRDLLKKHNVIVYSANFALYGDLSARVMQTLEEYATDIEIYSVDEAFMFLPSLIAGRAPADVGVTPNYKYCSYVRWQVKKRTGIPVSIGIGHSKTLAKIANKIAKKRNDGVFDITNQDINAILKTVEVADIWGIGWAYSKKLINAGIKNAYDLKNCDDKWARKNLTINGLRTVWELRGIPCLELDVVEPKKSITVSRSFGKTVSELHELKEAMASYMTTAGEKLRKQNMSVYNLSIFLSYVNYQENFRLYKYTNHTLPIASNYTPTLISAGNNCLEKIYQPGLIYKKVGVILDDFIPSNSIQMSTFTDIPNTVKQDSIMKTIDKINARKGSETVFYATSGCTRKWKNKRENLSAKFTTDWNEILTINI